eukprot:366441-Chlamydomonas_euryale.AAC.15
MAASLRGSNVRSAMPRGRQQRTAAVLPTLTARSPRSHTRAEARSSRAACPRPPPPFPYSATVVPASRPQCPPPQDIPTPAKSARLLRRSTPGRRGGLSPALGR